MDVAKGSSTAIGLRAIPVGSSLSKVGKERKVEVSARLVERKEVEQSFFPYSGGRGEQTEGKVEGR